MHFNGSQMSTQSEKLKTKITFHSVSAKNLNNNNNNNNECTRMGLKRETKTENEWNVELQCNEIKIAFHSRRAWAIFYCILCCVSGWGSRYFWTRTPQALFVHHVSLNVCHASAAPAFPVRGRTSEAATATEMKHCRSVNINLSIGNATMRRYGDARVAFIVPQMMRFLPRPRAV